ncbi:helix-turn-helix domain-containing protein [Mucilaginibacter sp.]
MDTIVQNKANKQVGKNIRMVRHKNGLSQEQVASRLGISIPALSKIETGVTDVNLSRLEQIAAIFEISVANLLMPEDAVARIEPVNANNATQQRLAERETEIAALQRKVIELYEELYIRKSVAV